MPTTTRDPRSIITPDAFDVSAELVGKPLARPRDRAWALVIDGVVIGLITAVTKSFALILGVVAAVLFVRAGFRRTPVRGSVFGRAMRVSVGCLGVFIAIVTAIAWAAFGIDFDTGDDDVVAPFRTAERVAELTSGSAADEESEGEAVDDPTAAVAAEIAGYSDSEALEAYRRVLETMALQEADAVEAEGDGADPVLATRRRALEARLTALVAGDSLNTLQRRVADLQDDLDDTTDDLDEAREELADATGGGVFGWIRDRLDDLGFGFGWAALYMTVFLSWWNGQTVGKKLMGIRVVRLDGEPITWWVAFERAGGYAAGFATGLLGFAQVWWDANRQGIHDRIVGTVVIVDKAEKVMDWESAL